MAEITFLGHRRIKPKHGKHTTQYHDELHGGVPLKDPAPKQMND
jgi:hypothetical protein